jgi:streptogramin lyase
VVEIRHSGVSRTPAEAEIILLASSSVLESGRLMAIDQQLSSGDQLGDYTIRALIGRGGVGAVYRAADLRLARGVALKVLSAARAGDAGFRDRALRESQLAASLDHPNVIPIYSVGEDAGRVYIAMRLVEGGDLRALLRREGRLEPARALAIVAQVGEALDAAHAAGLVHRDVKPANVLIDRRRGHEHCYLGDFGISAFATETSHADVSQRLVGTLSAIAPEQIRGDQLDGRADVYSLGCMLYECLTGSPPFVGDSDIALIFAHLEQPPPKPSTRLPELPQKLDEVVADALAKDPADRPATCRELVQRAAGALDVSPRRRAGGRWVAATAVAVVAVVGGLVSTARSGTSHAAQRSGSVVEIDVRNAKVTRRFAVSVHTTAVAAGRRLWAADYLAGSLFEIDPATGEVQRIPAIGYPRALALFGGDVYVASDGPSVFGGNVTRYDALSGGRIDSVNVVPCSIAAGLRVVYTAGCPFVDRLSTGARPLHELLATRIPQPVPDTAATHRSTLPSMAIGAGAVWVTGDALDRRLFRIAPRSGRLLGAYPLPAAPQAVAVGDGAVWVTSALSNQLIKVSPLTGRVTQAIPTGAGTDGVAVAAGSVWVACSVAGQVWRINPHTGRVLGKIAVGGAPHGITAGDDAIWVAVEPA